MHPGPYIVLLCVLEEILCLRGSLVGLAALAGVIASEARTLLVDSRDAFKPHRPISADGQRLSLSVSSQVHVQEDAHHVYQRHSY